MPPPPPPADAARAAGAAGAPGRGDVALAAGCLVLSVVGALAVAGDEEGRLTWWGVALLVLQSVPLVWRRRAPLMTWAATGTATAAYGLGHLPDPPVFVGAVVALATVAELRPRREVLAVAALTAVILTVGTALADPSPDDFARGYLVFGLALAAGDRQRERHLRLQEAERRVAAAEAERGERARRAVVDERARIARELHDVVAHHVTGVVVQAEAGATRAAGTPAEADFDAIGAAARSALGDLRRVVGVLRDAGDGPADLVPVPGLAAVGDLVAAAAAGGLDVHLEVDGAARPLPEGVDLSAYRIVQEALTNVRRHAPGARARVLVRHVPGEVVVEVHDDGAGRRPGPDGDGDGDGLGRRGGPDDGGGGGYGLVGIRERVALYGGELAVGPEGGGFAVRARLPTGGSS